MPRLQSFHLLPQFLLSVTLLLTDSITITNYDE